VKPVGPICIALLGASCADVAERAADLPTWRGDVEAVLAPCRECHAEGASPDLTKYESLVECRADGTRWAAGGDATSPVLAVLERADHANVLNAESSARFRAWVVESKMLFASDAAHPAGFADPSSSAFHGLALRSDQYRPMLDGTCARCHEAPLEKGGAVACASCHRESLQSCTGCHGGQNDPSPRNDACRSGAFAELGALHRAHQSDGTGQYPAIDCTTCHQVPEAIGSPGHLDSTGRAEVHFSGRHLEGAVYDAATQSCTASSCHGDQRMTWTETSTSIAECARCHGAPPPSHASDRCTLCHGGAFDRAGRMRPELHLDGLLTVGRACNDCHDDRLTPSLLGDPGAHEIHLSEGSYRPPLVCADCHEVPDDVNAAGHIDSDLPAEVLVDGRWDTIARRCADVACHGATLDGGQVVTRAWSASDGAECGDCHGLPPRTMRDGTALHVESGPGTCGACHRTRDRFPITTPQNLISAEGLTAHINGCIDLEEGCRQ
jgi:predicted CxxxxCH...CXXCH cytochrome family protein